jgi:DNA polymerase I-like protein with 3'-5' exonuclease and polymerase domains
MTQKSRSLQTSKVVAIDWETALLDGSPSVEFYREDFRIISAAMAWDGRTRYVTGEDAIVKQLQSLAKNGHRLVVHNLQFEYGCVLHRFPELAGQLDWYCDTQRLIQLADNGKHGTKLVTGAKNWLPTEFHDHKAPFHAKIAERGGDGGSDLHLLTEEELEEYNIADAVVTLKLYEAITDYFKEIGYDWKLDYTLYAYETKLYAKSKGRGVLVDRNYLSGARDEVDSKILHNRDEFYRLNKDGIEAVEEKLKGLALAKYKTPRGQANANPELWRFNINSTQHLTMLFVDHYQLTPKFFTPTGQPSMSAKFFSQWGLHAEPLLKWGNLEITQNQQNSLWALSEYDGRIHFDVRTNGTKTGRGAAGEEA